MPHGKLGKVRLLKNGGEGHQTEDQMATANLQLHFNSSGKEGRDHHYDRQSKCCTPRACRQPQELIDSKQPGTSVRVICNNDECTEGIWMHKDCFEGKNLEKDSLIHMISMHRDHFCVEVHCLSIARC